MVEMLELAEQEFKSTMINMLKTLMEKVDSMQKTIDNVSKRMEILRQSQIES